MGRTRAQPQRGGGSGASHLHVPEALHQRHHLQPQLRGAAQQLPQLRAAAEGRAESRAERRARRPSPPLPVGVRRAQRLQRRRVGKRVLVL